MDSPREFHKEYDNKELTIDFPLKTTKDLEQKQKNKQNFENLRKTYEHPRLANTTMND